METSKTFENYPLRIVALSNLVSLLSYAAGLLITYKLSWIVSILYLLFILTLEIRLIKSHCTACYYWGKTCGFGKGRVSSLFFKKGDTSKFCSNQMSWKDLIPDMLVTFIPLVIGIILLIIKFDLLILLALVLLVTLTTAGSGFIRGSMTCSYCKQRELGCPAEKLFNKGKEQ